MEHLLKRTISLEKEFLQNKDYKIGMALAISYALDYYVNNEYEYLNKSLAVTRNLTITSKTDFRVHILNIVISIELGRNQKAIKLIDSLGKYKNYIKNNEKTTYAWYLYLSSILNLNLNKYVKKNMNILELLHYEDNKTASFLLGLLKSKRNEEDAINFIYSTYKDNNRCIYIYLKMEEILKQDIKFEEIPLMIKGYLNWCMNRNVNILKFIDFNEKQLEIILDNNIIMLDRMYNKYNNNWVLKKICEIYIKNNNFSLDSYNFYKEALRRQIKIENLIEYCIKAAFENGIVNIDIYIIRNQLNIGVSNSTIKAYLYYIIVSDEKMKELKKQYENEIIEFAIDCIKNDKEDKHSIGIYKFLIESHYIENLEDKYIERIDAVVNKYLFAFDMHFKDKNISCIWIIDKYKNKLEKFDVIDNKLTVYASYPDFEYICFRNKYKYILKEKPIITGYAESNDIELYLYFFKKGFLNIELMIKLSIFFIKKGIKNDEFLDILKTTIDLNNISDNFKNECIATIANYLFNNNNKILSMEYYEKININQLNTKLIEKMLLAYIYNNNVEKVINLLNYKSNIISNNVLFFAIKFITEMDDNKYKLLNLQYKLLMNYNYDEKFLNNIVDKYDGTLEEFLNLNKLLKQISITSFELEKKILIKAIYLRVLNKDIQDIFANISAKNIKEQIVINFANYCVYKIFIDKAIFESNCIKILEKIYLTTKDRLIEYGLTSYYIDNNINTETSIFIIKNSINNMQKDEFIIPSVKNLENKSLYNSYIQKKQPFWYKSTVDKKIYFYYKLKTEFEFKKIKMKYFKFGIYYCDIISFYGDEITYYYSEVIGSSSVNKTEKIFKNESTFIIENNEEFSIINDALIYKEFFKFEQLEMKMNNVIRNLHETKGRLI